VKGLRIFSNVMDTETDYVTLLLCQCCQCKSEEIMSFGCFLDFLDCFSKGILFSKNYMQLTFFLFLSTGSF
jgi:hypothetical protein